MDSRSLSGGSAARVETDAERQRRVAWEAEMIARADADVAAGWVVDSAEVRAWIESTGTGCELPVSYAGR
jgi:predicted transcriptional regulator